MVEKMSMGEFGYGAYGDGAMVMATGKGEKRKEGRLSWKRMLSVGVGGIGKKKKKKSCGGEGAGEVFGGMDARGEWVYRQTSV